MDNEGINGVKLLINQLYWETIPTIIFAFIFYVVVGYGIYKLVKYIRNKKRNESC
jgi:heme/copper-type cytochrome/quinol oxidase subunit 2